MDIKDFTNHSGGCPGSDMKWDKIGRMYGFENHVHWRPDHLNGMDREQKVLMLACFYSAADTLKRPRLFRGVELCQRNWFQAYYSSGVYAISYILENGEKDLQGRKNNSGKQVVAGGTGWTVEMAIQMHKPVFVFDMNKNFWFLWDDENGFVSIPKDLTPILTQDYAGIGSRNPTASGIKAIEQVYKKTTDKLGLSLTPSLL